MKNDVSADALHRPMIGNYRLTGVVLTLCLIFFTNSLLAQGPCSQISFEFEHYEPCKFRARYQNGTDCYSEIRYILESGTFASWSVNSAAGYVLEVVSPSELWVTHVNGFLPLGNQVPLLFTLPHDLNTTMYVAYIDNCFQVGCEVFGGFPIESCPDLMDASIIGVKYKECGGLPFINQTPLSGWSFELLDDMGNVLGEQVSDATGNYAFYDLPLGQYIVREVQQPGWTANVPASGQVSVTLDASEQRVVNFGNCPPPTPPSCNCPANTWPQINLITNGNFSGSGGFSTGYTLNSTAPLQSGQYWIGSDPSQINAAFAACGDHTSGSGNMMVVNSAANQSTAVWCQTIAVTPNSTYIFEAWVASVSSASPANLMLFVNNVSVGGGFFASNTTCSWQRYCQVLQTGTNTSMTICLYNLNPTTAGNDFALDDISFRRCANGVAEVSGRVYESCDSMPYSDQPTLEGWAVQFLDTTGTVVLELETDSEGRYSCTYCMPPGLYLVKSAPQPDWEPTLPPSGEMLVNLSSDEVWEQDFAFCKRPPCPCSAIFTHVEKISTGPGGCCYRLILDGASIGGDCWEYFNVQVDAGLSITSWSISLPGWTVNQINPQFIQLIPPNGVFAGGGAIPITFCVTGGVVHSILTTAGYQGVECDKFHTFSCPECINCPIPTDLVVTDIGPTTARLSVNASPCAGRLCWIIDETTIVYTYDNITSIELDNLTPGVDHTVWVFATCDSLMSESSDTVVFYYPCFGGYTDCHTNLLSNGGFEYPSNTGLPNAADQIGLCQGWQQANNASGLNGVADWFYRPNGLGFWQGSYHDVPNQQYTLFDASCGFRYAGFDLSSCEGFSAQLSSPVNKGNGYQIGFWWSPRELVTSNFTYFAILSNGPCTMTAPNGGALCGHQCGGDFHVPVTVTPAHQPGTWYFHTYSAYAPMTFNHLTFTAQFSTAPVNNYIYVDEVCVRKVLLPCFVATPKIAYNPQQPNAFFGEAELGAGSSLVSAVWDFGDGTQDSSCCLGSVIHEFTVSGTYEVCLEVTAVDTSGTICSERRCLSVVVGTQNDKCDKVAAFLVQSPLDDCCFDLNINNTEANCFTQLDLTLSSGDFVQSVFAPGWNVAINGNTASLTPISGGFIGTGQDVPISICDPNGTEPYALQVDFHFGGPFAGGVCGRTFNFGCFPDTSNNCCSDYNLFLSLAAQVNTNEQYGDCSISVNGTALNDCMRIVWDWGDGNVEGPYTDNTPLVHNYTTPGPHTVCYTVIEVDAAGLLCWSWQNCLDVVVHCNDECECLGFANLQFTGNMVPPPPPVSVDCDNDTPVILPCIVNDALYNLEGNFGCSNACTASLQYQIFNQNQQSVQQGLAYFDPVLHEFDLSPGFKFVPGTYQIVLMGLCGVKDTCICTVNFTIPPCGCCSDNMAAFEQTIANEVALSLDPTQCKAALNIGNLPCQRVDWVNWGDGTITQGPFLSGAMPMHAYSQSGNYTVTYTATEINPLTGTGCFQKTIMETITMACDTNCYCGYYELEIQLAGTPGQSVVCGDTIPLEMNQVFSLDSKFFCEGVNCEPGSLVNWNLQDPGGNNTGGSDFAMPNFSISALSPGSFSTPGLYTLTMYAICGLQDSCWCTLYFMVEDTCCKNQAAFLAIAAAVQTFGTLGTCDLSFQAQGLNDCMQIRYDWGDNTSSGPFGDNVPVAHTYAQTGTYTVCHIIEELDVNGTVCHTYQFCEEVYVICDDCVCGTFSDLFARPTTGAQSIALSCGGHYTFPCPNPGFSIPITGKFECQGGQCVATTDINWTLSGPSGTHSGTVKAGPYFYLPILPTQYAGVGTYTLTLTGNCDGQTCPACVITFDVNCPDPCPCDPMQASQDAKLGFAQALWGCKGCFSPIGLNECDMVQWSVNGGAVVQMTTGTQSFCYDFGSSGTYMVTMIVTRKKSDGSICAQTPVSQTVNVICISLPDCNASILSNPRFSEGAVPGVLNSGGESLGWKALTGGPVVEEGVPGSHDAWSILLSGKGDEADVLALDQPICLKKDTGTVTMRIRRPGVLNSVSFGCKISVQLFRGEDFMLEHPYWNPIRCLRMVSLDLTPIGDDWTDVSIPYDISDWDVVDSCGSAPHGVLVRPIVYVTNALGEGQGGEETKTRAQIDNLCFDGTLVSVPAIPALSGVRIYPNPNTGHFSLELPAPPAPGTSIRVTDLTGRSVLAQNAVPGSTFQQVRAGELPNGLYFLQVVSEGRVLAVERFVKQ